MMNNTFEVYEELLLKKMDRVKEMHSLTLVWYDLLEKDGIKEVAAQVEERGKLINAVSVIDSKLAAFDEKIFSMQEKSRIDDINKQIRLLKDEMIECDKKVMDLFEKKMQETRNELKEISEQKKRTVAYGGLDYSVGSMYFNVKQ